MTDQKNRISVKLWESDGTIRRDPATDKGKADIRHVKVFVIKICLIIDLKENSLDLQSLVH